MEFKVKDWTYIFNNGGFDIISNDPIPKPNILYKLYSLNQNSFDALMNGYIYATHPCQFNDVFDCHDELIIFDDVDYIKEFLTSYSDFSVEEIKRMISGNLEETKTFVRRNFKEGVYRTIGVYSMTGNPNDILMWSYYTNHQGFCVEFDVTKFPFKFFGPFPINYQDEIEKISLKDAGKDISILYQTNVKYKAWQHENEWRLLIVSKEAMYCPSFKKLRALGGHDRKFYYPIEAIKSITLGNTFFVPEELNPIDNKQIEINLEVNFEQKSLILEYLSENKIQTNLVRRNENLYSLLFTPGYVQKVNYKKYILNAIEVKDGKVEKETVAKN